MRQFLLALAMLACVVSPAAAQDKEGAKDHPMVPRMPNYFIGELEATDFDKEEMTVADDKQETVEGKHWKIDYFLKEGARKSSALEILRNYAAAFAAKGGTKVYGIDDSETLRMKTPTGELWVAVDVANGGDGYTLRIIEKTTMTQQLELSASELAKALNEKGSIALHNILFDTGKATLKPESSAELKVVGDVLKADAALKLEIQGHTDNVGVKAANQTLSQQRAAAVRDYLVKTFSIAPDRLTAVGFGDSKPVAPNTTDAGKAANRRVELVKK